MMAIPTRPSSKMQQEQQDQAVLLETSANDTQNPQRVEAASEEHQPPPPPPPPCPSATSAPKAATPCGQHDPSNPFRALDTSDKLQHLFRKYPNLPEQLLHIYSATQPPEDVSHQRIPASLMQGVPKKDNWNHDIGIKKGKEALRKARKAEGEAGDAIREYSELVLHLMNTHDEQGEAATVLQQQMAQEDSKLIERLMAQERGWK
ncbi:hypothetical protein E4U53_001039 [Claviceps sorghi]|nr:hypothetical protein E4U53_001039 [Claviceps sorghi]